MLRVLEGAGRGRIFKWCLCAALLSEVVITPRLWTATRPYPTVPVIDGLPALPSWLTLVLAGMMIASIVAIALQPRPMPGTIGLFSSAVLLIVFDINRLQPWMYQYLIMFLVLAVAGDEDAWAAIALVLAGMYFWSGVQKANLTFATDVFPWMLDPLGAGTVERLRPLWWMMPVIEAGLGLALLSPRTRRLGIWAAVGMHFVTLLLLSPLGRNYNSSVWPWNFWLAILVVVVFSTSDRPVFRPAWSTWPGRAVLLLIGLLPSLDFVGRWDGFLSGSYYSGRLQDAWIYLPKDPWNGAKPYIKAISPSFYQLDVSQWAYTELNAPPYAEARVYKMVAKSLNEPKLTLLVRKAEPPWKAATEVEEVPVD